MTEFRVRIVNVRPKIEWLKRLGLYQEPAPPPPPEIMIPSLAFPPDYFRRRFTEVI